MLWVLAGSYYIRSGVQDVDGAYDEFSWREVFVVFEVADSE
jgi:hypothetical protein